MTFAAQPQSYAWTERIRDRPYVRGVVNMFSSKVVSFLAAACLALATLAPQQSLAAPQSAAFQIPVSTAGPQGTFTGVLRITGFAVENNALVATGVLTGTLTGVAGTMSSVVRTVTLPAKPTTAAVPAPAAAAPAATAGCGVLHLELGPLDLDLLGLVVHLDRVVLDITAVPGAGNLLGNLLCSVTNLLNTGGALTQIANLLNQILGLLG
jgi:hypothetical protein